MKFYYSKFLVILLALGTTFNVACKVEPPNYDFSIEALSLFMPGQSKEAIVKKYGKGEFFFRQGSYTTERFYIAHIRYRFPVFVQFFENKVVDFHASLPAYFLHDIFHHSLIKRIGKQDKYLNTSEQSVYVWTNKNGNRHVYAGACTITCFPLYYSVMPAVRKVNDGYKPFLEILRN